MAAHRQRCTGFTLLEIIVVMAILAIITAAVVPVYSHSMRAIQARSARNTLIGLLQFTQEKAVTEGCEYRLYLDKKENTYWVMRIIGHDAGEKILESVEVEWGMKRSLPKDLTFQKITARKDASQKAYYIACFPHGGCDVAAVEVRNASDRSKLWTLTTGGRLGQVEAES